MSVFSNNLLIGAAGQASGGGGATFSSDLIGNSVWLDGSSDFLDRSTSSHSTTKAVHAFWFQFSKIGESSSQGISYLGAGSGAHGAGIWVSYDSAAVEHDLYFSCNGNVTVLSAAIRDIGWYHILASFDLGASGTDKGKLFINGIEQTLFATDNRSSWGTTFSSTAKQQFGKSTGKFLNGYLAQAIMLDGQSIQAGDVAITDFVSSFTLGTNGRQFIPNQDSDVVALASTAGDNSFCLTFSNSGSLGLDSSTETNNLTANSMSAANQVTHTPSLSFPSFNPLNITSITSISNGALKAVGSGSETSGVWATQPIKSGMVIYLEATWISTGAWGYFGVSSKSNHYEVTNTLNSNADSHIFQLTPTSSSRGITSAGSALFTNETSWDASSTFQIAIDIDNGKLWFGVDDEWYNSSGGDTGNPATGANPTVTFTAGTEMFVVAQSGGSSGMEVNFGQTEQNVSSANADANGHGTFEFAPPSGFLAFCSANLATPSDQGIDFFNSVKYTGNGTAIGSGGKAITGVNFESGFIWIKNRDTTDSNMLFDRIRTATKFIESDTVDAEDTDAESLTTFGSDGFTLGNNVAVNTNSEDYISWNWKTITGSGSTTSPAGSLASTSLVAAANNFSIVSYTGTGSATNTGHGLGSAPEAIIVKNRSQGDAWAVYHSGISSDAETDYLVLNTTAAAVDDDTMWNDTAPTSSVFSIGTNSCVNASSENYIAYCFKSVIGVCHIGSFTGNGSADGPYVVTSFKPSFLMIKTSSSTGNWVIYDTTRSPINEVDDQLLANSNAAETTGSEELDILANGFKIRTSDGDINTSSGNYIYIAMADIGGNGTLPPMYGR